MNSRRLSVLTATAALVVGVTATGFAAPPQEAIDASNGAAAAAATAARDLNAQIDETGEPQGRGSAAFATRHADLAEKHAEKHAEHPGNAAAVHEALANGKSPSSVAGAKDKGNSANAAGQARRAEAHALNKARKALGADDE